MVFYYFRVMLTVFLFSSAFSYRIFRNAQLSGASSQHDIKGTVQVRGLNLSCGQPQSIAESNLQLTVRKAVNSIKFTVRKTVKPRQIKVCKTVNPKQFKSVQDCQSLVIYSQTITSPKNKYCPARSDSPRQLLDRRIQKSPAI